MRLVLPALLAAAPYCYAASPEFNAIMPRGGQTGTTAPVSLLGNRLDDAEEIVSYSPQIKVADFKVESATVIKAGFIIDPACPPGEHLFRVSEDDLAAATVSDAAFSGRIATSIRCRP